jgi:hypothetical protein
MEMMVAGLPPHGTTYPRTDYAAIARAVGAHGRRVEDPREVRDALREAFAHPGPALVDVVTDPDALSIPPNITRQQLTGFALSASKMVLSGGVGRMIHLARPTSATSPVPDPGGSGRRLRRGTSPAPPARRPSGPAGGLRAQARLTLSRQCRRAIAR